MFPLRDNIPARTFPVVNLWLITVNTLIFFFQIRLGPEVERFIIDYGFIPARFVAEQHFPGSFVPLVSSMFLHGSLLHVFSNMWMLWIFGDNVEDRMGHVRYLVFYLLCGIGAAFTQFGVSPGSSVPMIGASGAISGVIGAYAFLYPGAKILTFVPIFILFYLVEIPAYFFVGFWFFMQFLQGTAQFAVGRLAEGGVAFWAHIGGFVAGVFLLQFFKRKKDRKSGQAWW